MNTLADILKISIEAARFIAGIVPSLVELWEAHDKKDDVVIKAIDTALVIQRAENDRKLRAKHRETADIFASRDDEPTAEVAVPTKPTR